MDRSARSAYCTEKLTARPVQAQGTISYESSDPDIASVDAATGEITAKKPGKVKIIIRAAQTEIYQSASAEYELMVDHASVTAPTAAAKGLAEGDTCNITVTGGQTEAGTYTARAVAINNANYKLPAETTVAFVIKKADFQLITAPQAKTDLVYSGNKQELIDAGSSPNATLLYKLGDGEWTEEIPSAVHAGTYDVSYKITGDSNHNDLIGSEVLHITIAAKSIADADIKLADVLKYTGQQQTQEISKVMTGNLEVTKDDYEVTGNQATEAGVYTMTVTAKEGTDFTGSRKWTYVVAPVNMSQITKDKDGKVQIGRGTFSVKIEQDQDTAAVMLMTDEAEFIKKLADAGDITADELTQIADGVSMELLLRIRNEASLDEESRTQLRKKAAEKGYTPGTCFKTSLVKYMTENGVMDQGTVVSQTGKIKLTLQIPASLQNQDSKKERAYFILCNKSGNAEHWL